MNQKLSQAQRDIQKAALEFAKGKFDKDLCLEQERRGEFPAHIRQEAAELGFIGVHYPEAYTGGGLGVFENALIAEAFCQKDASLGTALMLSGFSAECLLRAGSEEMKGRWLPQVADGDILAAAAFAEGPAGAGLDETAAQAVREGDDWIVNGLKTRVANGGMAGFYCVLVRTDPDAAPEKGLSLILVEGDRPGVVCENPRDKLGMRLTPETDLRLEGVRVPGANLIGEEGRGLGQVRRFYEEAWIQVSAMALGAARGAFARALEYARKRMQFGRPIAGFQAIRHKIADMAAQVEQTAAAVYRSAAGFDQQAGTPALAAMTKLCACDAALHVSSEAIQILGGYGYMKEYEVERFYRDAKALSFFCGGRGFLKDFAAAAVIDKIR